MIRGVRGAITVNRNDAGQIIAAAKKLLRQMIIENDIHPDKVASVFISATADLTAAFPAQALREFDGWTYVPVMCMAEASIEGALPKCLRIMIHLNSDLPQENIIHVYLDGAKMLRPDLNK